jgi:uncharacterized membrane protein
MRQKTFLPVVGLIFLLIAIMHGLNGWSVPMWVSTLALLIAAYLAFEGLKLGRRS